MMDTTRDLKIPLPTALRVASQDLHTHGERLLRLAKDMPDGQVRVRLSSVITRVFAAGEILEELAVEVENNWPKTEVER
jgi:hypothetical protein